MADSLEQCAKALAHSGLSRLDQVTGMIWHLYPADADIDVVINALESAGLSSQNRARVRSNLSASRTVSKGKSKNSFRVNPRYLPEMAKKFGPITGAVTEIIVNDSNALIPIGTLPLGRAYIASIVKQINEGDVAEHFDSVAVMLRRLVESLLIECYVRTHRESQIQSGGSFMMLDRLISVLEADTAVPKGRNLIKNLRRIKDVGDNAAHNRNYITKKADIEDIKLESRRCLSEMAGLAGL